MTREEGYTKTLWFGPSGWSLFRRYKIQPLPKSVFSDHEARKHFGDVFRGKTLRDKKFLFEIIAGLLVSVKSCRFLFFDILISGVKSLNGRPFSVEDMEAVPLDELVDLFVEIVFLHDFDDKDWIPFWEPIDLLSVDSFDA